MYAIISSGGKQHKVSPGDLINVEKLKGDVGDVIEFREVLAVIDGKAKVGRPFLEGATVTGEIFKQEKDKKIIVFKSKRRKGYRKKQGHRQPFTTLKIQEIDA